MVTEIHELLVNDPEGVIQSFYMNREDAVQTYRNTYSKVEVKPTYLIVTHHVNDRAGHL